MKRRILCTLCLLVLSDVRSAKEGSAAADEGSTSPPFAVAAYLPEWRYEGANWVEIAAHTTHLILFSMEPAPDGRLLAADRMPRPDLLRQARDATRATGTKLLACFGGNGRSAGFSPMTRDPAARARFVANVVALCARDGFDGVDYNWEYPGYAFGRGYAPDDEVWRETRTYIENIIDMCTISSNPEQAQG